MDWLKGMNDVLKFIEDNLSQPILYESLSKIAGCSVYEFSRIFSFMAGKIKPLKRGLEMQIGHVNTICGYSRKECGPHCKMYCQLMKGKRTSRQQAMHELGPFLGGK